MKDTNPADFFQFEQGSQTLLVVEMKGFEPSAPTLRT